MAQAVLAAIPALSAKARQPGRAFKLGEGMGKLKLDGRLPRVPFLAKVVNPTTLSLP